MIRSVLDYYGKLSGTLHLIRKFQFFGLGSLALTTANVISN
jgi:hypothetical protein